MAKLLLHPPLGSFCFSLDVFLTVNRRLVAVHAGVLVVSADKIGPTMAVLRLDVQRNIEVSKQGLSCLQSGSLGLTAIIAP